MLGRIGWASGGNGSFSFSVMCSSRLPAFTNETVYLIIYLDACNERSCGTLKPQHFRGLHSKSFEALSPSSGPQGPKT